MPPLLALFSWPLVVLVLAKKFAPALAFVLAILAGFLLLPENTEFDLPMLPALTKHSMPALAVLLLITLFRPSRAGEDNSLLPQSLFVWIASLGMAVGALLTVVTNGDLIHFGVVFLPGMRLYDGLSQILSAFILLLPMLLARKFLARPETHILLLQVLCFAGLGYSLLALIEVRMSPQLNQWIYGFFPHSFAQHYRAGGWRPIVFLSHGLVLSIFFFMVMLAAAGLSRLDGKKRRVFLAATAWLFLTLILSKSFGALIIGILLLPIALFLGVRGQLIAASTIACLVLSYPVARSGGFIPVEQIRHQVEQIDPQRASSFATRTQNEDMMLAKAQQRPWFGWGGWGRSRVLDPTTGADITIADGYWIIVLGVGGWVRYLFEFGLLCVPLLLLLVHCRRYEIGMESSILALMLAGNLIDMLPNASATPLTWMIAGALWGRLELGRIAAKTQPEPAAGPGGRTRPEYSRSAPPRNETDEARPDRPSQYTRQRSRHERQRKRETEHG
ncbi:hypothetical protein ACFMPD_15045 [Sedimentitalea sp. HM32M-2]|uniref:hypothetical protein n=1 Tax=Sedimentitalea sp. HM32M-2 TaxID=3351566 RepID=UPI003633AAB9